MRKRPLCIIAVLFMIIQIIMLEGFELYKNKDPSSFTLEQNEKKSALVTGYVCKRDDKENSQRLVIKNAKIICDNQVYDESKILAYAGKNNQVKIGNKIKIKLMIENIEGPRNPGNFDEAKYYIKKGIRLRGYGEEFFVTDSSVKKFSEAIYNIRTKWKESLAASMDERQGGVLIAVLTGDKSLLNDEVKTLFEKNGIGHILAISGLHMSFVGMLVYNISRKCNMSFFLSGLLGVMVLIFYCTVSGNPVSALRAAIMFAVKIGAEITGRTYDMPTSLGIGAIIIVLFNAHYLTDSGFLLSFSALLGIGVLYPFMKKHFLLTTKNKIFKLFAPGLSINIISFPIMSYFFYEVPLYSLALNIFVIPLMSLIMIFGISGSILSFFITGKYNILLYMCSVIFKLFEKLCLIISKLPCWRIVTGKITITGIILYYSILFLCALYILLKEKRHIRVRIRNIISMVTALIICILLFCPSFYNNYNKMDITMIDVGQGDGIYIQDVYGHNYLVDGGSTDIKNPGDNRIIPFLLSKGVRTLDYCFVTHGDTDHKNGLEEIIRNQNNSLKIKSIVLPDKKFWDDGLVSLYKIANENDVKVYTCKTGDVIRNKKFEIEIIGPSLDYKGPSGNEASLVFMLRYKSFKMLFTGDLEGEGEKEVEESKYIENVNVLKVAHHGSLGTTSSKFLDKTKPLISIISCGVNNRYGHPGKETIERLESVNSKIYCTNKDGAIMITTNGKTMKIKTFLQ